MIASDRRVRLPCRRMRKARTSGQSRIARVSSIEAITMYKSRSRFMQRGSNYRDQEKVALGALYRDHPPALTRQERSNFEFGAIGLERFIVELAPVVRQLSKAGFRKPKDVARLLNKKAVLTASGARWTPRLAYFLLSFVFAGEVQRQTEQSGKRLKLPKRIPSDVKSSPNSLDRSSAPASRHTPLTTSEMARRLEALGRVKLGQKR